MNYTISKGAQKVISKAMGRIFIWLVLAAILYTLGNNAPTTAQGPQITKIAWSVDGQLLAVGYQNGNLEIRNASGQLQTPLVGHSRGIGVIAWNPTGTQIVSGSTAELFVWNVSTGEMIADLRTRYGNPFTVTDVSWSQDGSQIMVYVFDRPNRARQVWNANTLQFVSEGTNIPVTSIKWSIDKKRLAMGTNAGGVLFGDSSNFDIVNSAVEDGVISIAPSPGGQRLVSGNWANTIKVWSIPSGSARNVPYIELEVAQTLRSSVVEPVHRTTYILDVAFDLSGNRVYSVLGNGEFAVWNANASNQPPISTSQLPGAPVTAAAFNAGGTRLVYGDSTGTLRFYDVPAEGANDVIALFNTSTLQTNLFNTLASNPPADNTISFATGVPTGATGGQWVMGDWDGDGVKTPGVYGPNGVFYYTNVLGPSSIWGGTWFGLLAGAAGNRPVAGRFNANVNHDCIGVTDSSNIPPYGMAFAIYFTCDFTQPNPPKTFQWLSVLLPDSQGHSGIWEFSAGNFDPTVDAVDTIACRRGNTIVWTNTPPTTQNAAFSYTQYIGAPYDGTSLFVVGDWNSDGTDSFGLYYPMLGRLRGRNDLDWNTGLYPIDQQLDLGVVGTTSISATIWRLR